jgi:hypothetical protein
MNLFNKQIYKRVVLNEEWDYLLFSSYIVYHNQQDL